MPLRIKAVECGRCSGDPENILRCEHHWNEEWAEVRMRGVREAVLLKFKEIRDIQNAKRARLRNETTDTPPDSTKCSRGGDDHRCSY